MKIVRDGKEIELTKEELRQAYEEQEEIYDIECIRRGIENYLEEYEYEILKDNEDFIQEAAWELRRNIDKYDMSFDYAIQDAISEVSGRFLNDLVDDMEDNYE